LSTKTTVRSLSVESGFEVEDVIIELLRMGLAYAKDPNATIRAEHQRKARAALGLHPPSDERKKKFWEDELGLTPAELVYWRPLASAILSAPGLSPRELKRSYVRTPQHGTPRHLLSPRRRALSLSRRRNCHRRPRSIGNKSDKKG